MKKTFLCASLLVCLFSACEDKSKAEKMIDKVSDKAKEVSKDVEEDAKNAGDSLKKEGEEVREKAKKEF